MRRLVLLCLLCTIAFTLSCITDIKPKTNIPPRVWFVNAPGEDSTIFENAVFFQWVPVDIDDDVGMGKLYVNLTPTIVGSDSVFPPELQHGWVRVYRPAGQEYWGYNVASMPDTAYTFSVKVIDARGAETIVKRDFTVRYDPDPPIIDDVECPPAKPTSPNFPWTYVIHAHDVAPKASAATPPESLTYSYSFRGPSGVDPIELTDFKPDYKTFSITIDGQRFPGTYTYRGKARDRAGNTSLEYVCKFDVGSVGPK